MTTTHELAGTTSVAGAVKIGDYRGYLDGLNVYVGVDQNYGPLVVPWTIRNIL